MGEHAGAYPCERTEERKGYGNGFKLSILIAGVGYLYLIETASQRPTPRNNASKPLISLT